MAQDIQHASRRESLLDGVYVQDVQGELGFHVLPTPSSAEVADIARRGALFGVALAGLQRLMSCCSEGSEAVLTSLTPPLRGGWRRSLPLTPSEIPLRSSLAQASGGGASTSSAEERALVH